MEKITVVIPNYNGIKFLPGCLDSLKEEYQITGKNGEYADELSYKVLVIDNGSSDGSCELISENYPSVELIRLSENTGFCHAVNVGIEASCSEYVLLLNNDTKAYPGFIEELFRAIDEDKKCFSVSAQMLMWDDESKVDDAGDMYCALGWSLGRGKGKPASEYNKEIRIFSACGGAAIYRRAVFDEIGVFDELHFAYLEDLDVGYRAKIAGFYNKYCPEAKVVHFGSATTGSRYNDRKVLLSASNNVYVPFKNMPVIQLIVNLPFLLLGYIVKFTFFTKKGLGAEYIKGIWLGIKRCASKEGRAQKVKFKFSNFTHYLVIECELLINILKIIKGS